MMILDRELEAREAAGRPVRVGLCGAGYMGRGLAAQLATPVPGLRLVAVANRTLSKAQRIWDETQPRPATIVEREGELGDAVRSGQGAVCADAQLLAACDEIDVVVECTGTVEHALHTTLTAIERGKHVVLCNAELDATLGPLLQQRARQRGVVLTNIDGDEPGVAMNLVRFVRTLGCRPVLAGNLKGFIDPYRTPDTQRAFADSVGQDPPMITSFADGTKLSLECTLLANAAGLQVGRRGMFGPRCGHVRDIVAHFTPDQLLSGAGLVDYALGAEPGTGAFVVGHCDTPLKQQYLKYFKMGDGPFYVFHTPYHLPQMQAALTIGRAVLFGDAAVAPAAGPRCDVVAVAKRDLAAGERLDGIGGFTCYGAIENYEPAREQRLLPIGLSVDARLRRAVPRDQALTYDDVTLPAGRACDLLRQELEEVWPGTESAAPAPVHA